MTLDPASATDLDQAFAIERSGDDLVLRYAIADVGFFVDDAGVLDAEAWRRGGTVYELQVASGDLGRVIGRQGRTAAALRTLLASVADDERRVSLDIRDQSGGR